MAATSTTAPAVLPGATSYDKLEALCGLTFEQQAIWFLNAFWDDGLSSEVEKLWGYVGKCSELDLQKVGNALDELNAHRFLEVYNETMTVREMRTALRTSGAIHEGRPPKLVPLSHVLIFKYKGLVSKAKQSKKNKIYSSSSLSLLFFFFKSIGNVL